MSENNMAYYISILKKKLHEKQKVNPNYSLRAFAKGLEMDSSSLSKVLKNKRPLSYKKGKEILGKLQLNAGEEIAFLDSLTKGKDEKIIEQSIIECEKFSIDESYYHVIAEWEYYGVLSLTELQDFVPSSNYISKKMGIHPKRAEYVLDQLIEMKLLKDEKGKLVQKHPAINTVEDKLSAALRESYRQHLKMAESKIDQIPVDLRDFSSLTLAVSLEDIPELKRMIRLFRRRFDSKFTKKTKTDVYQLGIQLFPLTTIADNEKDKEVKDT